MDLHGNILTSNNANQRLSLYDKDFFFIKHIENLNSMNLRPLSLSRNDKDSIL
jgi:hypothetical protein